VKKRWTAAAPKVWRSGPVKAKALSAHQKGEKMTDLEEKLIRQAHEKHNQIFPCPTKWGLEHCFTRDKDKVYFWYNTKDQSTHVVSADINN
jgi:hypothetical protein